MAGIDYSKDLFHDSVKRLKVCIDALPSRVLDVKVSLQNPGTMQQVAVALPLLCMRMAWHDRLACIFSGIFVHLSHFEMSTALVNGLLLCQDTVPARLVTVWLRTLRALTCIVTASDSREWQQSSPLDRSLHSGGSSPLIRILRVSKSFLACLF
jgi:hypothetical protein